MLHYYQVVFFEVQGFLLLNDLLIKLSLFGDLYRID